MQFFIIFKKTGVVELEDGLRPPFFNTLIKSLNFNHVSGERRIQDDYMEYKTDGHEIFLSIGQKGALEKLMKSRTKMEEPQNTLPKSDLDFSDKTSTTASIVDSIKKADLKRTFGLFKGEIALDQLKLRFIEHLVSKNVDPSFCQTVTADVLAELKRDKIDLISEEVFKSKIRKTLSKILPKFNHDSFITKIKDNPGVYSIAFVGVNGVGKSTTLAKIACWLIQKGLRVYIAACDTFRAGAVEQLKVHVDRFKKSGNDVGFFESGYAKDDSAVAKHAIMRAQKEQYDVILIDTAGRMHNKENLMLSLTKLIKNNNPDHILFVGEALVGGDSLQHIMEFNKRISDANTGRKIDSVILTKMDTVDDKIGQVLNFTFTSNAPIMFLGTGQSNVDLTPLDSELVAEVLTA